jgi:hypothetical protein
LIRTSIFEVRSSKAGVNLLRWLDIKPLLLMGKFDNGIPRPAIAGFGLGDESGGFMKRRIF